MPMHYQDLEGKVVIVAGASSGMGQATARKVAHAGANVVLAARREEPLAALADDIAGQGGRATAAAIDVTDQAAVDDLIARTQSRYGRIDAVINTVGTNIKERALDQLTSESWSKMLNVNLTSAFNLTRAVVPVMRNQRSGLIIYVSSSAVKKPDLSGVAYQASKAGLVGLAHGTMEEERMNGIRTTVVFPGLTDTPMVLNRPTPTPPEVLQLALRPEDVALACHFVLSLPARAHVPEMLLYPSHL